MWKQHSTTSMKTQRIETFLEQVEESAFGGYMCGRSRENAVEAEFNCFQKKYEIHRTSNHVPRISWTAFEPDDLPRCSRIPTTKDLFQPMLRNFQRVKTVSTSAFPERYLRCLRLGQYARIIRIHTNPMAKCRDLKTYSVTLNLHAIRLMKEVLHQLRHVKPTLCTKRYLRYQLKLVRGIFSIKSITSSQSP